jgi:hypothetical protein
MADTEFTLRLVDNLYPDLKPYEVTLEEGFSVPWRANLTVLSATRHSHTELVEKLLDQKASLTIAQRLPDKNTFRKRYLHGIVTAVKSLGVFSATSTGKKDCFSWILKIESELSRLRYTRETSRSYYRKTPADVIEELARKHDINIRIPQNLLNRSDFGSNLNFEQVEMTDFDFFLNMLYMYGISYTSVHEKAAGLGQGELVFFGGESLPVTPLEYTDNRKVPEMEEFDFLSSNEAAGVWKMAAWSMEDTIGVDSVAILGGDGQRVGKGKNCFSYGPLFHGYDVKVASEEVRDDVKRILEARFRILELEKTRWRGEAGTLVLRPGCVVNLSHFYGAQDKEAITAKITRARLEARTLWPQDLAVPPERAAEKESLKAEVLAMNYGKTLANKRFCVDPHGL